MGKASHGAGREGVLRGAEAWPAAWGQRCAQLPAQLGKVAAPEYDILSCESDPDREGTEGGGPWA